MRDRQEEKARWRAIHNRKPGEKKDPLNFLELRTPQEVATILGVSRQRVQQIEREALTKLRRGLMEFWNDWR